MNFFERFKSLPTSSRRLLGIGVTLALVVALPLFIWAIVTQNFNPNKRAASGEPGVCIAQNKIITVTPFSDINGTCHNIQDAINAVNGDGYTVQIEPGVYDVSSTIFVNGKTNLTITGNSQAGSEAVKINFTPGNGWGFLIENSSGSLEWMSLLGGTSNGMLSINNSSSFSVGYLHANSQTSHTMDVHDSSNISIYNTEIQSSAGALQIGGSSNVTFTNNKIHDSDDAISINDSQNVQVKYNLIYNNRESGIRLTNLENSIIAFNTFVGNSYGYTPAGSVYLYGNHGSGNQFSNNIVTGSAGAGIKTESGQSFASFLANDIYANHPNYMNFSDKTGVDGNISANPLLNSSQDIYCPQQGSPVIYGNPTENKYMGYYASICGSLPPTPSSTPTPQPTPPPNLTIITSSFINGRVGESYRNFFYGEVTNLFHEPTLSLNATNTPPGLSVPQALCGTSAPIRPSYTIRIECALDGIPTNAGNYQVRINLSDGLGNFITKDVPILILPGFTPSPTPSGSPSPIVRPFVINFKFEGINDDKALTNINHANVVVKFLSPILGYTNGYITPPIQADYVGGGVYALHFGIWSGDLPAANNYAITLKGDKHISTRFCTPQGQTSHCSTTRNINIPTNPAETVNLDFTGIPLQPGDVYPQDGVADINDFNKVVSLLAKPCFTLTDQERMVGDLNYDGCVTVKDVFLIRQTLQSRYDEN